MRKSVIIGIGCFIAGIVVGKVICKKTACITKFLTDVKKCACSCCSEHEDIDEEQDDIDDINEDIINETEVDDTTTENDIAENKVNIDEVKE